MKAGIYKTSESNKGGRKAGADDFLEIDTIDELLKIIDDFGHPIVIYNLKEYAWSGTGPDFGNIVDFVIEIYDDYME